LEQYSDEALNKKPQDNGWSALQIMNHLMIAELGALKNIEYYHNKGGLKPKIFRNYVRAKALRFAFWLPMKFKAPPVSSDQIPAVSNYKSTLAEYQKVRTELGAFLENLPESSFQVQHYKHPVVGMLTLHGMMDFHDTHFNRHRKQILAAIGK
jgi:DinB superfamily